MAWSNLSLSPQATARLTIGAMAFLMLAYLAVPWFAVVANNTRTAVDPAHRFTLTNQDGNQVTQVDFSGKPSLWFYGFTHCPQVCPTALAEITTIFRDFGEDADRLAAVFVSVDPERDTPSVLKEYLSAFDPRIVGLTGSLAEIERMTKSRLVVFKKVALGDGDYTVDHSAGIYLIDASGNLVSTLDPHESMEIKLRKVRMLIAKPLPNKPS